VLKLKTVECKILTRSHTPSSPPSSCEELTTIALSLRERVLLDRSRGFVSWASASAISWNLKISPRKPRGSIDSASVKAEENLASVRWSCFGSVRQIVHALPSFLMRCAHR
jgi:hypothetical protein